MTKPVTSTDTAALFGSHHPHPLPPNNVLMLMARLQHSALQTPRRPPEPVRQRPLVSMIRHVARLLFSRKTRGYPLSPHLRRDIGLSDLADNGYDRRLLDHDWPTDNRLHRDRGYGF
jgi:hypothetical protein